LNTGSPPRRDQSGLSLSGHIHIVRARAEEPRGRINTQPHNPQRNKAAERNLFRTSLWDIDQPAYRFFCAGEWPESGPNMKIMLLYYHNNRLRLLGFTPVYDVSSSYVAKRLGAALVLSLRSLGLVPKASLPVVPCTASIPRIKSILVIRNR
jgi:hypothetical protein